VDRDVLGGRFKTGHRAHRVDQHFPVMRPGPADERPVDIEQHQGVRRRN